MGLPMRVDITDTNGHLSLSDPRIRLWAADCAARVLPVYEAAHPGDLRVRNAIIAARQFARGQIDAISLHCAGADALSAARTIAVDAVSYAARCATGAAFWATVVDTAGIAAVSASELAASAAVCDAAEREWQRQRLAARMSDYQVTDWPLAPMPVGTAVAEKADNAEPPLTADQRETPSPSPMLQALALELQIQPEELRRALQALPRCIAYVNAAPSRRRNSWRYS